MFNHFATVSVLNNMFPPNGVHQALRYVYSRFVGVLGVLHK